MRAGSVGFVAAGGRITPPVPSDLVFTLAERLNPVSRVDVLAIAGSGCAASLMPYVELPEDMCSDLGLSPVVLGFVVLLRARGTILVD